MYRKHLWRVSQECQRSKLIILLAVQYFSANDILLRLCKAKMKIYKRSLQGLLSSTLTALLLALTCVLLQLTSLAIHGEF